MHVWLEIAWKALLVILLATVEYLSVCSAQNFNLAGVKFPTEKSTLYVPAR
jgi:hypothetical protein